MVFGVCAPLLCVPRAHGTFHSQFHFTEFLLQPPLAVLLPWTHPQDGIKPVVCVKNTLWIDLENSSELSEQVMVEVYLNQGRSSECPFPLELSSAQIFSSFCPVLTLRGVLDVLFTEEGTGSEH